MPTEDAYLRTPSPVPFGICECSFVETTDTQLYHQFMTPYLIWYLIEFDSYPGFDTTISCPFPCFDFLLNLTWLNIGFHWASATGVACLQGTLTPPVTWSCPTYGLASVLMLRPMSPELVLFPDVWVSNILRYFCFCSLLYPHHILT